MRLGIICFLLALTRIQFGIESLVCSSDQVSIQTGRIHSLSIQGGGRCQLDSILLRLAFQTTVYQVWRERNARRHHSGSQTVEQLIKLIDKMVRNRISSLRYRFPHKLEGLMRRWFDVVRV